MEHTLEITALAHGGDGIGRIEGQVCFVPGGLPGDVLRVQIARRQKKVLWAEAVEVAEASPARRDTSETAYTESGVCSWLHFAYPAQAEWKQRIVREQLAKLGGVEIDVGWADDPSLRLGYRTRAVVHGDGERLGFFKRGTHEIVDVERCPLCHPKLNAAFATLRETSLKGSATVTVNPEGDEVLVWTKFSRRNLRAAFPMANSPQDKKPPARFLFDGVPVVNGCFSQGSLLLNRVLRGVVHEAIGAPVSLLDLYCGSGNFSLSLSGDIETIVGMDRDKEAIKAADKLQPGQYRAGNERKMGDLLLRESFDTVLLNPLRTGAKELLPALTKCGARAMVYVSCDPATLGRDLHTLREQGGWTLQSATAVDMFPYTPHIETVCRLERGQE